MVACSRPVKRDGIVAGVAVVDLSGVISLKVSRIVVVCMLL